MVHDVPRIPWFLTIILTNPDEGSGLGAQEIWTHLHNSVGCSLHSSLNSREQLVGTPEEVALWCAFTVFSRGLARLATMWAQMVEESPLASSEE